MSGNLREKGCNRLIYHSISLLQTVIFVKKFLSGFDGQIYKGKEKAQQNKINGAKVIVQYVQESQERVWRGNFNWKNMELHL